MSDQIEFKIHSLVASNDEFKVLVVDEMKKMQDRYDNKIEALLNEFKQFKDLHKAYEQGFKQEHSSPAIVQKIFVQPCLADDLANGCGNSSHGLQVTMENYEERNQTKSESHAIEISSGKCYIILFNRKNI